MPDKDMDSKNWPTKHSQNHEKSTKQNQQHRVSKNDHHHDGGFDAFDQQKHHQSLINLRTGRPSCLCQTEMLTWSRMACRDHARGQGFDGSCESNTTAKTSASVALSMFLIVMIA